MLQNIKELAAEAGDDENIVLDLIPPKDSENSNKSKDHIDKNSTVIPVFIYHTGYTSPTIVHYLVNFSQKKDRYNQKHLVAIGKGGSENDVAWITLQPANSSGRR